MGECLVPGGILAMAVPIPALRNDISRCMTTRKQKKPRRFRRGFSQFAKMKSALGSLCLLLFGLAAELLELGEYGLHVEFRAGLLAAGNSFGFLGLVFRGGDVG